MSSIARAVTRTLAVVALLTWAQGAAAFSSLYTSQCSGCHDAAAVGSSATTCNGCHAHGTHPTSSKSSINVTGSTTAASYQPGESVSVVVNGGYRNGWIRAVLYDHTGGQVAISTGPNGMGGGAGYPVTLTAPAPSTPGTYTWKVAWYGNAFDAGGAAFGPGWTPDPGNPGHGYEVVDTNVFTVTAPAAPVIALSPASLGFGSVNVGTSASLPSQVRNTGTATLTVTGLARCTSPATSAEYSFSAPALPFNVAPGGAVTLSVTYTPSGAGTDTGCIAVTSNASNGPTTNLAVSGTGVVPAAPRIAVSPTSLSFGDVTVGASAARTFTIGNTGTATLTGAVARAGGTSTEYSAAPATFTVAPGGSQTVTVTYAPVDTSNDAGALLVTSNDAASPSVSVAVSGAGVAAPAPSIALSPTSLSFGAVGVGASASLVAAVENAGTAPLEVTQIARCPGTSAEFTWSPAAPFTVAAGGSTSVTVTYAPTGAGGDTGCLAFSSNDATHPAVQLAVSGSGQPAAAPRIAVSPTALSFGNVTVGTSAARTFSIDNTGTATLHGTVARMAGTSAEYAASTAAFTIPAGGSEVVTVTYSPVDTTADGGTLLVASDDPANPTVQVTVSGTGVAAPAPAIELAPNALAFGTIQVGSAASLEARIRNAGTATLHVAAIAACAGASGAFSWTPSAPFDVAPGGSAALTVTYAPVTTGPDSSCLEISSDDSASPVVSLGLSGEGVLEAVPAIALAPSSLDFGTVTAGGTASRTASVRNDGTGPLHVTGIALCAGTPDRFTWSPAAPFTIAAGEAATLAVTYSPTVEGSDAGCLALASDDPALPVAELGLNAVAVLPPVPSADVDVDIDELEVEEKYKARGPIRPEVELENRSAVAGSAVATLVGVMNGTEVYRETLTVTLDAGAEAELEFPAYEVPEGSQGTILWTLTVEDQDPDVDEATARTRLLGGRGPPGRVVVDSVTADSAAGGCSTGGGAATGLGVALLALLAAARARRRA